MRDIGYQNIPRFNLTTSLISLAYQPIKKWNSQPSSIKITQIFVSLAKIKKKLS